MARKIVTEESVRWAVSLFAPYKSPGIDGIFPALLQKGLDILIETMVKIFRACITYGYNPVQWHTSRVVFVPKPVAAIMALVSCIVKGQGFISPVDTGRQRAHTPSPSDSQL